MASKRWWRRPVVIVPTAIVAVTALTLALAAFQPWRLFIDVTVDEALPTVDVEETVKPSSDASAQEAPNLQRRQKVPPLTLQRRQKH